MALLLGRKGKMREGRVGGTKRRREERRGEESRYEERGGWEGGREKTVVGRQGGRLAILFRNLERINESRKTPQTLASICLGK